VGVTLSAEDQLEVLTIRLGSKFVALDRSSAKAWVEAAGPTRTADLVDTAGEVDVRELISAGLLVALPSDGEADWIDPFFDLIPVPLTRIGSSGPNSDGSCTIADWNGQARVELDQIDYILWSSLNGRTSIRDALRRTASELEISPALLRDRVVGLISGLVTSRSIVLDGDG